MEANILPANLEIENIVENDSRPVIHARSTAPEATCPACGHASRTLHGSYARAPDDLPIGEREVTLHLHVRRFQCRNPTCSRRTFAEAFPNLLEPHAQRTTRLRAAQARVGITIGAEAGNRLLERLSMPTSPDTLLRLIRAQPIPLLAAPRVLGVDDWAFKRGKTYGTILVDLERRRVIDLLEERSSSSLETWLKAHPGVEIISRDRGQSYAQGAKAGAPNAVQVADRWHLLKNLGDAVREWLERHRKHLKEPVLEPTEPQAPVEVPSPADQQKEHPIVPDFAAPVRFNRPTRTPKPRRRKPGKNSYLRDQLERQERRNQKLELYAQAAKLREEGLSARAISRRIGVARATLQEWLSKPDFPKRKVRTRLLDNFVEYVKARMEEPDVSVMQMFWELVERGYTGSRMGVYTLVAALRAGVHSASASGQPEPTPAPPTARYSARTGMWMFVCPTEKLDVAQSARLQVLKLALPAAGEVHDLAQAFGRLIRERTTDAAQQLETWLERARSSGVREIARFAQGLEQDKAAVIEGLTSAWSNGQTEGQVTRLKLIKRSMYGRARFDLLRARVLLA